MGDILGNSNNAKIIKMGVDRIDTAYYLFSGYTKIIDIFPQIERTRITLNRRSGVG